MAFFYQVPDKHDFDIGDRNIVDKVIGWLAKINYYFQKYRL